MLKSDRLIIEKYFPCQPLRHYVHHYLTMKGDIGDQTISFRDIPDGNILTDLRISIENRATG